MKPEPSVSVIIPCYNHARFLADAIESVLAQSVLVREIVVVDDGSSDHPEFVCEKYPIVHYHRQENAGVSRARNKGLSLTSGSHVIFLDADDMLLPIAVETQIRAFRENPGLGLAFGLYKRVDENARPLCVQGARYVGQFDYEDLLRDNIIGCPATVMFRRVVLEHVGGFDPSVSPNEDYEVFLRVSRHYPVLGLDTDLAMYRLHISGHSRNLPRMLRQRLRVLERQRDVLRNDRRLREAYSEGLKNAKAFYGSQIYWASMRSARGGDFRGALNGLACLATRAPSFLMRMMYSHAFSHLRRLSPRSTP